MENTKNETEYKKYTKSRRKYNAAQIGKGVALGISLAGFGASMKGAFDNIDLTNIEEFAKNTGNKALDFYKELAAKCNPGATVPAYIFLGLSGAFIIWMIAGRIKKRRFETASVSEMSTLNAVLLGEHEELKATNEELQKQLTIKRKKPTPVAPTEPTGE